jgi:hypothetical protein
MAIDKRVRIMAWATGDGSARKFTVDLLADPQLDRQRVADPHRRAHQQWFAARFMTFEIL